MAKEKEFDVNELLEEQAVENKTKPDELFRPEKKDKYLLTVFILPGDGTPRILPISFEVHREDYNRIKKQLKNDPIPEYLRYHSIESGEPEILMYKSCERIFSVTVDKVQVTEGVDIVLPGTKLGGGKIIQQ